MNKFPPLESKRHYSSLWNIMRMKSLISSGRAGDAGDGGTYQQWNVLPEFGDQFWMWIWRNLPSTEITCFKRWHLNMLLVRQGVPKAQLFYAYFLRVSVSDLAFPHGVASYFTEHVLWRGPWEPVSLTFYLIVWNTKQAGGLI